MEALVAKHAATATDANRHCATKKVTPHVLRHSCAMALLRGGVDRTVLALWLGHEQVDTTDMYMHADLSIKERALARTKPPHVRPGRYRPPDRLLAFLQASDYANRNRPTNSSDQTHPTIVGIIPISA